jgi:hypothetical protein
VRDRAGLTDQAIGGGLSGGEEKESPTEDTSMWRGACAGTTHAVEIAGVAAAANRQDARQSVMEASPAGQQGQ